MARKKKAATKKKTAAKDPGREAAFSALKKLLARRARQLVVVHDEPGNYYLDTKIITPNGKPLFFGAVQARKSYVSLHLMPVYTDPVLCSRISPELKKRKQGKSCFNFQAVDKPMLAELDDLIERSYTLWAKLGRI